MSDGQCIAGERCSCGLNAELRAKCVLWSACQQKPRKVFGLIMLDKDQGQLIKKHCCGDCGKISMAGIIKDEKLGGLLVCVEEKCPWLGKQMDEPYGTTMSFGQPHEVYLRVLTDTPADGAPLTIAQAEEMVHMPRRGRHLRYCLLTAGLNCGENRHPQVVMKELGITYSHSTPQSMGDQWWFWNCIGLPVEVPKYLSQLNLDPMQQIGYGLSAQDAKEIADIASQLGREHG